jgi:hypothetical protein
VTATSVRKFTPWVVPTTATTGLLRSMKAKKMSYREQDRIRDPACENEVEELVAVGVAQAAAVEVHSPRLVHAGAEHATEVQDDETADQQHDDGDQPDRRAACGALWFRVACESRPGLCCSGCSGERFVSSTRVAVVWSAGALYIGILLWVIWVSGDVAAVGEDRSADRCDRGVEDEQQHTDGGRHQI